MSIGIRAIAEQGLAHAQSQLLAAVVAEFFAAAQQAAPHHVGGPGLVQRHSLFRLGRARGHLMLQNPEPKRLWVVLVSL